MDVGHHVPMVHDELEDFATPVVAQRMVDDEIYNNEMFNNVETDSDDDDMYYNYDGEYFY